jgi:hypothetical protein
MIESDLSIFGLLRFRGTLSDWYERIRLMMEVQKRSTRKPMVLKALMTCPGKLGPMPVPLIRSYAVASDAITEALHIENSKMKTPASNRAMFDMPHAPINFLYRAILLEVIKYAQGSESTRFMAHRFMCPNEIRVGTSISSNKFECNSTGQLIKSAE